MRRFEEQYPITARGKEIREILQFVTRGLSCQLISVPGAGRSTVLRLLAYHQKLRQHHLKKLLAPRSFSGVWVYLNFAEIPSFEASEFNKSLFLTILSSIETNKELHKNIMALLGQALKLGDSQVLFQNLKKALQQCQQFNNSTIIFLFDRFSEFTQNLSPDFFSNLRTLRTASGGKLAVVFSTHLPLEELLPADRWRDFYEFFIGNHVSLEMYDKVATDFRVNVLEQENNKKLEPVLKEKLVELTGGHGKLMKLATQILLTPRGWPKGLPRGGELVDFLLSHILIRGSLLEIWQATTPQEREVLKLPLFSEFVKRGIPQTLVPKTIRLDEMTNQIFFGDKALEDLTGSEFRLLSYFLKNPNRVCGREEIIGAVWTETKNIEGITDQAIDQMIFRLRKKIEDEADNPKHLLTVKGRGFRFIP